MPRTRHRQHGNPFAVRGEIERPDWPLIFGRSAPLALDVGCGAGRFVVELARRHPEWDVIGLEIRQHFVDGVLTRARAAGLRNVHAVLANANAHLDALVPDASVAFVAINFPDPWFKKRHHKRRVVQPAWVDGLRSKLLPNAEIHVMTDFEPGASQIAEVFAAAPGFTNLHAETGFAPTSTTGLTSEREQTHRRRGERIWRLHYRFAPA